MPRDLGAVAREDSLQGSPEITMSPEQVDERSAGLDASDEDSMLEGIARQSMRPRDEVHPYTQTLSISDVDSCTRVEEEAFPPNERCPREKFLYRLKTCGELSLGIFTSRSDDDIPTAQTSAPVYSGTPQRKAVLLGQIVATKTTHPTVTVDDMKVPSADRADQDPVVGHLEEGRTVCIHSFAVLPQYQHRGLGRTLMEAYLQRIESHSVADRVALVANQSLIPYYESFGFENKGLSDYKFAGADWYNLVKQLKPGKKDSVAAFDE